MRVRIRFSKQEPLQYIGHLDIMRFFQKAIRRAGLPAAYSGGFSPHILMSFASPLGVGKVSESEYFDLDLREDIPCDEIVARLREQMAPGMDVRAAAVIEESKKANGMRVIAAASYTVTLPGDLPSFTEEQVTRFLKEEKIEVLRKTKKKEELTDIRPWIYEMSSCKNDLTMLLSAGSLYNLKPELVLQAIAERTGRKISGTGVRICRNELYADRGTGEDRKLVSLLDCDRIKEDAD